MIVIDIDNFKHLNDSRGHGAGDRVLCAFARQVKETLRSPDLLARLGGDEFAILLPDSSSEVSKNVAERIRQAIEALEVPFETGPVKFTISAGVAELDPVEGDWKTMIQRADKALYDAKRNGRNSVAVWAPETESSAPV
jgi:diguanylate cyclase (GGDEF)-like protein